MHGPPISCLTRSRHPELKDIDLRLLVIGLETPERSAADDSVRSGGLAFRFKAWKPGGWNPFEMMAYSLTLTDFPDPGGGATFFTISNPRDKRFIPDELL